MPTMNAPASMPTRTIKSAHLDATPLAELVLVDAEEPLVVAAWDPDIDAEVPEPEAAVAVAVAVVVAALVV